MTEEAPHPKKHVVARLADFIDRYWKPLTFVGVVILLISGGILLSNQFSTGSFMPRDVELSGGKEIEIVLESTPDLQAIKAALPDVIAELTSGLKPTLLIETSVDANETQIFAKLNDLGISGEHSIRTVGPFLGELFWRQTQIAIIAAFILMSIVVFILFRSPAPSLAIIQAALTDVVFALAVLSLTGEKLSLPILAGALMLIGYSVDTDIVLTTELLRSPTKDVSKNFRAAAKTGIMLTAAALAALITMYFVSGSVVIKEIASVLIIGLLADIPSTWLTNGGILRWFIELKTKKEAKMTSSA